MKHRDRSPKGAHSAEDKLDTVEYPRKAWLSLWRAALRFSRILTGMTLIGWLLGYHYATRLPSSTALVPSLSQAPEQTTTDTPQFLFDWRGRTFVITPRANYAIHGLVVSHNNVGGIGDIYHDGDSVDLKDLCLVWGGTATHGLYQNVTFWSEPWSCHYSENNRTESVNTSEVSNNHLLAGTKEIANQIRAASIGDQIEMRGYLVDYSPEADRDMLRKTSLIREDTGDGACEVVFVTAFRIIKTANDGWRKLKLVSGWCCVCALAFALISSLLIPYLEYRYE